MGYGKTLKFSLSAWAFRLTITLLGMLAGYAVYNCFYRVESLSPVLHKIRELPPLNPVEVFCFFVLPGAVLFNGAQLFFAGETTEHEAGEKKFLAAMAPLALFVIYFFFSPGYWSPLLFIFTVGLCVYRLAIVNSREKEPHEDAYEKKLFPLLILLAFIFSLYGFYLQWRSLQVMYLLYPNWGVYLGTAENTLAGKWFITNELGGNFLASHFCLLSILLIVPVLAVFYSVNAFFMMTSLVIYSAVPMLYLLSRKLKLPVKTAFILGLCALFSPSLINMNLNIFYGFDSIYIFIPFLIFFFVCFETKKYAAALIVFSLSLLLKETVAVFWACLGIVFILRGNRKAGIAMFLGSTIYWLLVTQVILPSISGDVVYDYTQRFSHLGNNMVEVALSPILRPKAFWGSITRSGNFYFIISMLLPVFILTLSRPLLILGGAVTITFVCIQKIDQFQNICLHYQTETVILIYINTVLAASALAEGKNSRWFNWLETGLKVNAPTCKKRLNAALASIAATSLLSWYFLGQSSIGKHSFAFIEQQREFSTEVEELKQLIPPGVPMTASYYIAAHFILRNPVSPYLWPYKDYLLMDINVKYGITKKNIDIIRREMLTSGKWELLYNKTVDLKHFLLFKKVDKAAKVPTLPVLSDREWLKLGYPVKAPDNRDFAVRSIPVTLKGKKYLKVAIRLLKKVNYDVNIDLLMYNERHRYFYHDSFGMGINPAFLCKPGSTYIRLFPIPDLWDKVKGVSVRFHKRAEINPDDKLPPLPTMPL